MKKPKKKVSVMTLRRKLDELESEEREIADQVKLLDSRLTIIEQERQKYESKVEELTREHPIQVTDHAVLRYLQHIEGVNVDAARRRVLPDGNRVEEAIKKLGGSGTFPVETSHRLVVKKGIIVTVLPH